MRVFAYVYPGWHPIPERDRAFHPGFTEWDLVLDCAPRFPGHAQPRRPLWGRYDDRDPIAIARRVRLAARYGVDGFVYGLFWCRGKRVFQDALDCGLLGSDEGRSFPFALMWANRLPRRVLPVSRADLPVIDPARRVPSDREDFVQLIDYLAARYFARPSYATVGGKPYFSIFDTSFFLRELGLAEAACAIRDARALLAARGFPGLHLAAIEPARDLAPKLAALGFDSVTHYVHLPDWKGPFRQRYDDAAAARAREWPDFARRCALPYFPSVSPGWDATPRGQDFGEARPKKYPWWPVVEGEHPDQFRAALARALAFARDSAAPLAFIASWNEWSEGHYLEPDERFGEGWLEAVRGAR